LKALYLITPTKGRFEEDGRIINKYFGYRKILILGLKNGSCFSHYPLLFKPASSSRVGVMSTSPNKALFRVFCFAKSGIEKIRGTRTKPS
jgi:hypothetical protein